LFSSCNLADFVQVFQSDLSISRVSDCSQVFLPFRSHVNLLMVLTMWLTHYDHQFNAVHGVNLLFIYLEHTIKRILALSLNWKVNFKLFNPKWVRMEACICSSFY